MDKETNAYIEKQKSPQKEILQEVRKIFQKTLPGCEEKMVWGGRNVCVRQILYRSDEELCSCRFCNQWTERR